MAALGGTAIVSTSADTTVRLWELATGRPLRVLEGHRDRVNACAVSPMGVTAVTASFDGTLRVWDLNDGHVLRVLTARWLGLDAREGRHFVLGTGTLSVLGWERDTPAIVRWNAPA